MKEGMERYSHIRVKGERNMREKRLTRNNHKREGKKREEERGKRGKE